MGPCYGFVDGDQVNCVGESMSLPLVEKICPSEPRTWSLVCGEWC